jgi:uncharacterized protein YndB with AHSA1/START domain
MTEQTYTLQAAVGAPPPTVYAALTSLAALQTWLAEHAEVALDDGVLEFWGRYTPHPTPACRPAPPATPTGYAIC